MMIARFDVNPNKTKIIIITYRIAVRGGRATVIGKIWTFGYEVCKQTDKQKTNIHTC